MTEYHHPEEQDAPYRVDQLAGINSGRPYGDATVYLHADFGDVEPARLHGCPFCGEPSVPFAAFKCWRCDSRFTPASDLPPRAD